MKDKFGRECVLDLSPLLNENYVVMYDNQEQGQAIIDAAIEQYPDRVNKSWHINGVSNVVRGVRAVFSFRGYYGRLSWGNLELYIKNPDITILSFDDLLQSDMTIPESDFGLEYIL